MFIPNEYMVQEKLLLDKNLGKFSKIPKIINPIPISIAGFKYSCLKEFVFFSLPISNIPVLKSVSPITVPNRKNGKNTNIGS